MFYCVLYEYVPTVFNECLLTGFFMNEYCVHYVCVQPVFFMIVYCLCFYECVLNALFMNVY